MSYLVLARKYRPRNFTEMVGQEHVVQALTNALTQQRLHHAYLFTGTRGVGKTTVSRILAKSLNCQGPDGQGGITATPCGVCQACTDIDSGRFVDYTELDAASNRGRGRGAGLLEQAVYKPVQGRFKVFMIDEVHMLTNTAFNAMLKTLEEPPEYLKFVLATTDPQKVPVTVLSRCLQFNLRPMAPETVLEHLTHVLAGGKGGRRAPAALRLLARAARGSMRDALSLTDQAIAFGSGSCKRPRCARCWAAWTAPCVPPDRGAGAQATARPWWKPPSAARQRPERGVHAGRNERRAAAHGRAAGRAVHGRRVDDNDPEAPRSRAWPR
jgi:DNA polymerase-3 subunit gamma/tau